MSDPNPEFLACGDPTAPYNGVVKPGSWLAARLDAVANPRRRIWNAFRRACRRIPKGTPCYRARSWKQIDDRRCQLIEEMHQREVKARKEVRESAEFKALQACASAYMHSNLVATNFCLGRYLRRLKRAGFAE